MMKKKLLVTCLSVMTLSATPAMATQGYLDLSLGFDKVSDSDLWGTHEVGAIKGDLEYDMGLFTSAAVGVDFGQFRVEGEIGYAVNDFEEKNRVLQLRGAYDGEITSSSVMLNGYFDAENNSRFTPYVGLGFGFTSIDFTYTDNYWNEDAIKDDDLVLAHQVMIGLEIEVNSSVSICAEYRYFGADDPEFETEYDEKFTTEYKANMFLASVTLPF